jgi:small GTP-binding protein
VAVGDTEVTLILWDLAGEDEFQRLQMSYLRGTAGYILVADGTRQNTLDSAFLIHRRVERDVGEVPFVLALNKCDLQDDWEIQDGSIGDLKSRGWSVLQTSAKSGEGVEETFRTLTEKILGG